jgi:predicted  nucleic acid-binding Zn-ribbon protein
VPVQLRPSAIPLTWHDADASMLRGPPLCHVRRLGWQTDRAGGGRQREAREAQDLEAAAARTAEVEARRRARLEQVRAHCGRRSRAVDSESESAREVGPDRALGGRPDHDSDAIRVPWNPRTHARAFRPRVPA